MKEVAQKTIFCENIAYTVEGYLPALECRTSTMILKYLSKSDLIIINFYVYEKNYVKSNNVGTQKQMHIVM